ncbi:MAG: YeeE/YedE thiosulfate transporter family protein [bacterium]
MGPLVPDIIGGDLNFIIALLIGILFGAILEQAGFSTSKKLVGLFYGYDFTVLRVFFTAGIVAMIGIMALAHFGLIDISLIYINPTFLWSAIVGGLIMGLGFVIGGFCPGTSVCAAAIGKIDAMIFIAGAAIGVFIFAEGYPLFEGFYKAANWGNPRLFETLGMSQSLFAFLLTSVALLAFVFTSIIENRVNGIKKPVIRFTPYYIGLGVIGLLIALSSFIFPERKADLLKMVEDKNFVQSYKLNEITSDELACRIMSDDKRVQIIDFRPLKEYEKLNLPKSTLFLLDNLFEKEPNKILTLRHKVNVFVAEDELSERKIAVIASELGYKNIRILKGGLKEFKDLILNPKLTGDTTNKEARDTYRFRMRASLIVPDLIKKNKATGPVKKKQKRVVGGC